jgi:hypothetical protein
MSIKVFPSLVENPVLFSIVFVIKNPSSKASILFPNS